MSLNLFKAGFLLPAVEMYGLYMNATLKLPLPSDGEPEKLIHENDPGYAQRLHDISNHEIKQDLDPMLDRENVRKDIVFIEEKSPGGFMAMGTNYFRKAKAIVFCIPQVYQEDREAARFVLKHEIAHIKHNDNLTLNLFPGLVKLAAAVYAIAALTFIQGVLLIAMLDKVKALVTCWREAKADDFAIKNSSTEELLGGRRFWKACQLNNIQKRTNVLFRLVFSASGENRLDLEHPSLQTRIKKIEQVLKARNVLIDEAQEKQKIDILKDLINID